MSDCPICAESYTKSIRHKIDCPSPECEFSCCKNCIKNYITVDKEDPKCMSCKKIYTRTFLQEILSNNWLTKQYKPIRENILLEREKAKIPNTMGLVENERAARDQEKELRHLNIEYAKKLQELHTLRRDMEGRRELIERIRDGDLTTNKERKVHTVKCPNCPGFLNTKWKCPACESRICRHCRDEIKSESGTVDSVVIVPPDEEDFRREPDTEYHVCDPDTLASARAIRQDTRPCPKCGTPIHKIEGCDQMWDPQCGTAFSWRTGRIVTGIIHNPHYFQFMRENGGMPRQPGDVQCGGPPTIAAITQALGWVPTNSKFNLYTMKVVHQRDERAHDVEPVYLGKCSANGRVGAAHICDCPQCNNMGPIWQDIKNRLELTHAIRLAAHITDVEQPHLRPVAFRYGDDPREEANQRERVKYIMDELSEQEYKSILFQRERRWEKNQEVLHVYDTFVNVVNDILRKFVDENTVLMMDNSMPMSEFLGIPRDVVEEMYRSPKDIPKQWWSDNQANGVRIRRPDGVPKLLQVQNVRVINTDRVNAVRTELDQIEKYCNDEFKKIAKLYKLVAPMISISSDRICSQR